MTQQVDTLFINALVLTMDENFSQYHHGAVAVQGDGIVAVGPEEELKQEYAARAQDIIDCGGKILMPGLINAHTHVPMTLLRGLADDLRLDVWLMGYMMPVEREFVSPEFVRLGTLLACAEQIRSGVTTFNDMYYFEEDVARAAGYTAKLPDTWFTQQSIKIVAANIVEHEHYLILDSDTLIGFDFSEQHFISRGNFVYAVNDFRDVAWELQSRNFLR